MPWIESNKNNNDEIENRTVVKGSTTQQKMKWKGKLNEGEKLKVIIIFFLLEHIIYDNGNDMTLVSFAYILLNLCLVLIVNRKKIDVFYDTDRKNCFRTFNRLNTFVYHLSSSSVYWKSTPYTEYTQKAIYFNWNSVV